MADLLAVISKGVFEKTARGLRVGDLHAIRSYDSNPKPFEALATGGTLYVVTRKGAASTEISVELRLNGADVTIQEKGALRLSGIKFWCVRRRL